LGGKVFWPEGLIKPGYRSEGGRVSTQVTWWASRQYYKRRPGRRTRQVACMVCEVENLEIGPSARVTKADKASASTGRLVLQYYIHSVRGTTQ
jgi:hypothetical protein